MNRFARGFTLPELMVVLALAAVILGIGAPFFRDYQRNNRLTVAANDILGLVLTSRVEALRRQITVSMCPSASPEAADATCDGGTGWIVFQDTNGDCARDAGEELITGRRVDSDVEAFTNSNCISFMSTGFKRLVAGLPTTSHMLFCDDRGNTPRTPDNPFSVARGIEVGPTGRGTVVKRVDEIDDWGGSGGVSCP